MKKALDILHIYAGTGGSAGLYLSEIYGSLNKAYTQEVVVSKYFPFAYGNKWFYKWSDLSTPCARYIGRSKLRLLIRYLELMVALFRIAIYASLNDIKIVNYGLTSDLQIEYRFLSILKRHLGIKIMITCHDVLPFYGTSDSIMQDRLRRRKQIFFSLADYLLVHNQNAKVDLEKYYDIDVNKVIMVPFPVMDLRELSYAESRTDSRLSSTKPRLRVGIIGHLRKEKGLETLMNAWFKFYSKEKSAELVVAGNLPSGASYDFEQIKTRSATIIDHFVPDWMYRQLITQCDVIVLPYSKGTNSGLPSSIISLGTLVITSDIPMFRNNPLVPRDFIFKVDNADDLCDKLEWLYNMTAEEKRHFARINDRALTKYRSEFGEALGGLILNI